MTYAIVTMHDAGYRELADITYEENKVPYCVRHGYKLFAKTDNFSQGDGLVETIKYFKGK